MERPSPNSQHAMKLIEEAAHSIETMEQWDREDLIKLLLTWMIADKLGVAFRPALQGLSRFCIAECLRHDPYWVQPYKLEALSDRKAGRI